MRVAKDRGHRLSDVVTHASKQLASLRLTNAFAYPGAIAKANRLRLPRQTTRRASAARIRSCRATKGTGRAWRPITRLYRKHLRVGRRCPVDRRRRCPRPGGPDGVKASTPFGHASAVVTAIVDGMMRRAPHDPSAKRRPSTETPRRPVNEAHARAC